MLRNRRPNFFETFDRAFDSFGSIFDDFRQNHVKFFKSTAVSVNDEGITVLMKRSQDKVSGFITGELAKIEEKNQQEQQLLLESQKGDRIKELEAELQKLKSQ